MSTACPLPGADGNALPASTRACRVLRLERGECHAVEDQVIAETAVALVFNGLAHTVLMATPEHLEDFALGFCLSEHILQHPSELYGCDIRSYPQGVELQLEIASARFAALKERRRSMAGRTGCGLCGVESLDAVAQPLAAITSQACVGEAAVQRALQDFSGLQPLHRATGAAHAAAWVSLDGAVRLVREDVGRHNALDKLIGALQGQGFKPDDGFVLISSRASYEMVQKTVSAGVGILVAMSAATAYAVELAERCQLTLAGFARPGRMVVYSQPQRLPAAPSSVRNPI